MKPFSLIRLATPFLLPLVSALVAHNAFAESTTYPMKSVSFVTWTAAGSGADTLARKIAKLVAIDWGQPVIVENKPGAAGLVAGGHVLRQPLDGHTILLTGSSAQILAPLLKLNLPYDPQKDLTPVTLINSGVFFFVVPASSPYKTIEDFMAAAATAPKGLSYGSTGNGSAAHVLGQNISAQAKKPLHHVPYAGEMAIATDLQSGILDSGWLPAGTVRTLMASGRIRPLAVTGSARNKSFPDVPTFKDAGLRNFEVGGWTALYVAKGTDPKVVQKIGASVLKAMRDPDIQISLNSMGIEHIPMTPEQFADFNTSNFDQWKQLVSIAGLKAE